MLSMSVIFESYYTWNFDDFFNDACGAGENSVGTHPL